MEEIPEEYLGLLRRAKTRRWRVSERTKRRISKIQWELGMHHGSEEFFGETHQQTVVPLSGGHVQVSAKINLTNLEKIFDHIGKAIEKYEHEGYDYDGSPTLLQMEVYGPNGGKVHIVSAPQESGSTSTVLHIIGMGHTKDVAKIMKIVGQALKELHRSAVEEQVIRRGECESVR